jgi:hypothetical protein
MSPASDDDGRHGLRHAGDDAFQLTVDYLKQETIDPLRGLGRFLYMGIAGSVFLAFGILLVLVGILRLLQTETGSALTGDMSWVPYAVVVLLGILVIAVAVWRVTAGPGRAKLPEVEARKAAEQVSAQGGATQDGAVTQQVTAQVTAQPPGATPPGATPPAVAPDDTVTQQMLTPPPSTQEAPGDPEGPGTQGGAG